MFGNVNGLIFVLYLKVKGMANRRGYNVEEVNRIIAELTDDANERFETELTGDDIRLLLGVHRKSLIHFIGAKQHFSIPGLCACFYNQTKAAILDMEKQLKQKK